MFIYQQQQNYNPSILTFKFWVSCYLSFLIKTIINKKTEHLMLSFFIKINIMRNTLIILTFNFGLAAAYLF